MNFKNIKNCSENWLIITFSLFFSLGILGCIVLDMDEVLHNSRSQESTSLFGTLFLAIIFAPVLEELSFRGLFLSKKIMPIISLTLISCFSLFSYHNYYVLGVFILFMVSFFIYKTYHFRFLFKIICILNALLFGFIHYKIEDFTSVEKGFVILFQISIGFLLIWVTLNFGLIRSMLVHAAYNGVLLSFIVISVQFPDTKINNYEDENIKVEWQRVPYFESLNTNISTTSEKTEAFSTTINKLYIMTGIRNYDEDNEKIVQTEAYMKYNFKIYLKENAINEDINKATNHFFLKEKLILPTKILE